METYECQNCTHTGPLDKHGRCEMCGSDAVMSTVVMNHLLSRSSDDSRQPSKAAQKRRKPLKKSGS
jgi:predicted ATP-dependent serine protease